MLKKSEKFGTTLTVGPRLKKLMKARLADGLLWREIYPKQEDATPDGRGEFQCTREWIETASLHSVFDLWCRGHNLVGYADTLLYAAQKFKKVCGGRIGRA